MKHDDAILDLLLDRYERSGHCLPGKQSDKRVMLTMSAKAYPPYKDNSPETQHINAAVMELEAAGLVSHSWRKGYEGWLLDKVYLNLDRLSDAYARIHRTPLAETAQTLQQLILDAQSRITTAWKLALLRDEYQRLSKKLRPSQLLPQEPAIAEAILRVLAYTEQGPELIRIISANCFHDSKYLEQHLDSKLVSIARAYEPELMKHRAMEEDVLSKNEVLKQIGILTYPEIFEIHGNAQLVLSDTILPVGAFQHGFCLQSENAVLLQQIRLDGIHRILFVENRTNYRHMVMNGGLRDTLIVYHGGFYSQSKRRFFQLLADALPDGAAVQFWGDIDLGGFSMFTRLKRDLFPTLEPYKMGLDDFEAYRNHGLVRSSTYLESVKRQMIEGTFDPIFHPVANAIIQCGHTVEQEIML